MGLYSGGLIIERIFASEIWGAYFREGFFFWGGGGGLLSEFYGIPLKEQRKASQLKNRRFPNVSHSVEVVWACPLLKHEATRYERAEGLGTSIKTPNETISLVEKSTGFLFMLICSDFLSRLISELNFYFF